MSRPTSSTHSSVPTWIRSAYSPTNETGEHLIAEGRPDREQFPHLKYPPFTFDVGNKVSKGFWGDLRIDNLIDGKVVISKVFGLGADKEFVLVADETTLVADGADAVRVVLRVNDEYGNVRLCCGWYRVDTHRPRRN